MSRNRRHDTATQRSMGDFVSRAGSSNRVEISDDEDDEIEEINTVSIKMDKWYEVVSQKWYSWRIPGDAYVQCTRPHKLWLQIWHLATSMKGKLSSKLSLSPHLEKAEGEKTKNKWIFCWWHNKRLFLWCCLVCWCLIKIYLLWGFINCHCSFVAFFALCWNLRSDC